MTQRNGIITGEIMHFTIGSDPIDVRAGLVTLLSCPAVNSLDDCARGTAEIVLAEVLNNIVEHAYAETSGEIQVSLCRQGDGVYVVVRDHGLPMPQEQLPQGRLPDIDSTNDMPEGGFGWFLIRTLVQGLTYNRIDANNHLSFVLPIEPSLPHVS